MNLNEYRFPAVGRGQPIELVGLGDIHYGSESCDVSKLKRMVEWIRNRPNCYWVGLGDYSENISYRDIRRFNPENVSKKYTIKELKNWGVRLIDDVGKILKPIANKCIGLNQGNHELDYDKNFDHDATQRLSDNLGVPNLGWTCMTRLLFTRKTNNKLQPTLALNLLTEHSYVAGRKKGGKLNRIEDRASDFDFDIILWGHSHDKVASKKTRLYVPKSGELRILTHEMVFGIVPSFLRTYEVGTTGYGEMAGYSPTTLGILLITIKPFAQEQINKKTVETHEIHISQ